MHAWDDDDADAHVLARELAIMELARVMARHMSRSAPATEREAARVLWLVLLTTRLRPHVEAALALGRA